MATAAKFRNRRCDSRSPDELNTNATSASESRGLTLPEPPFPQFPDRLMDPGPETPPEKRKWGAKDVYRYSRGWLAPYIRSRVLPGEFHPITAYLFVEYKCNLDWLVLLAYDNKSQGQTEDVPGAPSTGLYDNGCRVLALMVEATSTAGFRAQGRLLRCEKGFWVYIADERPLASARSGRSASRTRAFPSSTSPWIPGTSSPACPKL